MWLGNRRMGIVCKVGRGGGWGKRKGGGKERKRF